MGSPATAHPFGACAFCGQSFEPDVTYPVVAIETDDGELELYSFCGECCEGAWREQRYRE